MRAVLNHEDLLGFLLGALEPHEMRRVADWLRDNPEAQAELAELEEFLEQMRQGGEDQEHPPNDLVARSLALLPPSPVSGLVTMSEVSDRLPQSNWSWRDGVGAIAAAALLFAILLPTMVDGRFEARRVACQNNLRQLGVGMSQFAIRNAQSLLPPVEAEGPEAFAGMYAVRLRDADLLGEADLTHCPSIDPDQFWVRQGLPPAAMASSEVTVPMLRDAAIELASLVNVNASGERRQAKANQLKMMQQVAGGHYAYTLGVQVGNLYSSPRYEGRAGFAMLSDVVANGWVRHTDATLRPIGHGGRGVNVLYEDGSVRFINAQSLDRLPDPLFFNALGRPEAGVNIDDASLAPSWQPPFVQSRQR